MLYSACIISVPSIGYEFHSQTQGFGILVFFTTGKLCIGVRLDDGFPEY